MASDWARNLSLRWLGISSLLSTLALLLVAASLLGYFMLRGVLWVNGLISMDWLLMSKLGVVRGRLASDVDQAEFYRLLHQSIEVAPGWQTRAADFSQGIYAVQLLDRQGRVMSCAPPVPGPSPEDLQRLEEFRQQLERGDGKGPHRLSYRGSQDRQILLVPLASRGTLVGFAMMTNNWLPGRLMLVTFAKLTGGVVAFILAVILIVYLGLVKQLARPLACLVACARQASAGDLKARSRLEPGRNEIYLVGAAFDTMLDRLERLFQAQQNFVADVSHELRTPLTALAGQLHILQQLQVPEQAAGVERALQRCQNDLDRMTALVEDLLALIRAEEGPPQNCTFDLNSLVCETLDSVRYLYPDRRIHWQAGFEASLLGDPQAWQRAVQNLVRNACQYSQGEITVSAHRQDQGVRLDVHDQGPGLGPECLARLGQRFYRPDSSRSRNTGGSGLGLAIARATAEQHGGWMRLTSQPGVGTTASLYIPAPGG